MKKTVGCAFVLGGFFVSFLVGVYYGDWANRQAVVKVDMTRPTNAVRLTDGEHQFSRAKSEDGRQVYLIWRR